MSMDGIQVCKEIAGLHDSIVGTEIVEKGVTIAEHARSGTFSKLEKLFRADGTLHECSTGKYGESWQTTLSYGA